MDPRPMKVTLISAPEFPIATLYYVWMQSRHDREVPTPKYIHRILQYADSPETSRRPALFSLRDSLARLGFDPEEPRAYDKCAAEIRAVVSQLMTEAVPVTEFLTFVFEIENAPISLREQLVRHRIGVAHDPRIGADLTGPAPHVGESAWWSQTSRVLDLSHFYEEGRYVVPKSLKDKSGPVQDESGEWVELTGEEVYHECLRKIEQTYQDLQRMGVHIEDCRQVIPLCTTHRFAWQFNLKAMMHILGKRTCWIAQLGLWEPLVAGIAQALTQLDPMFRALVNPPCIKNDKFASCPYDRVNTERINGMDGVTAPCPMYLYHNPQVAKDVELRKCATDLWTNWDAAEKPLPEGTLYGYLGDKVASFPGGWYARNPLAAKVMTDGRLSFEHLWQRNVDTGAPQTTKRNPTDG